MKAIFTIFFILICYFGYSQCDTTKLDTMSIKFNFAQYINKWNYYNADGTILWKDINKLDPSMMPIGGFISHQSTNKEIQGYIVWKVINPSRCDLYAYRCLDANKKVLDGYLNYIIFPKY